MNETPTTNSTTKPNTILVRFKGYTALESGEAPIFQEGENVNIDINGQAFAADGSGRNDTLFNDEWENLPTEVEATPEVVAEATPVKKLVVKAKKAAKVEDTVEEPKTEVKVWAGFKPLASTTDEVNNEALRTAQSLSNRINETFWSLGGVLSYIIRNKCHQTIRDEQGELKYAGKNGFAEYVEKELDTHYRRAMYYIEIVEAFAPLGIDENRLLELGWAKVKELTRVVNPENVDQWLTSAKSLTRDDLVASVKQSMVASSNEPRSMSKMVSFKFRLFEDQGEVALTALNQAKATSGEMDDNAAFAYILQEYMMFDNSAPKSLEDSVQQLINQFGLEAVTELLEAKASATVEG